jgi:CubicO group peptidase (beta-lactamase class C family)
VEPAATRRGVLAGVGTGVAGLTAASTASVAGESAALGERSAATGTRPDVESLVDDLLGAALDDHDVPGATVAVVADGTVLTKGYGVADRERGAPVDPATTRFRVGSVSKPVVWTALARLVTRGDLDPTEPVPPYLEGVPLDTPYDAPTTPDLATHRSGFEASNRGLWIEDADRLDSLSEHLRSAQPAAVRPPGEAASYSNYGAALAGGMLADAVGDPFEDAVADLLLDPAGMTGSSFAQPPPDPVAETHATGHGPGLTFRDGQFPYVGLRPAGSLSATADDMGRVLRLRLNDGVLDGERVLASETVETLHRRWATAHEALPGLTFGFVERYHGDVRTLWHNGSTITFHSDLVLVSEAGLGLFVSFNGSGGSQARGDVREGFLDALLSDANAGSDADVNPERTRVRTPTSRGARDRPPTADRPAPTNSAARTARSASHGRVTTDCRRHSGAGRSGCRSPTTARSSSSPVARRTAGSNANRSCSSTPRPATCWRSTSATGRSAISPSGRVRRPRSARSARSTGSTPTSP